jgi:hypothetical protein
MCASHGGRQPWRNSGRFKLDVQTIKDSTVPNHQIKSLKSQGSDPEKTRAGFLRPRVVKLPGPKR